MRTSDPRRERDALYYLLPEVYRVRDADQNFPLRDLLRVIAEQAAVVEEDVAQLYNDLFIETCAPWVIPYIADLVGLRGVPGSDHPLADQTRAEVAHTISYRRRKGTAAMLEQLARDVTEWPAHAVEFFELLATTQHLNHIRPQNRAFISVRKPDRLEYVDTAFERDDSATTAPEDITHIADVRRIAALRPFQQGRYNIPNVGIFLWRLKAQSMTQVPARNIAPDRYLIDPVQSRIALFHRALPETDIATLSGPLSVPAPISRRMLASDLTFTQPQIYGSAGSLQLFRQVGAAAPQEIPAGEVAVRCLEDTNWISTSLNLPQYKTVAIDPVTGRIAFASPPNATILVTYHYGFSANIGGGEYSRVATFAIPRPADRIVNNGYMDPAGIDPNHPPHPSLSGALNQPPSSSYVIEIRNSASYMDNVLVDAGGKGRSIELRAAEGCFPTLQGSLEVTGHENDTIILNGLRIGDSALKVSGSLGRLVLRHCTLLPQMGEALRVDSAVTEIQIESCILGGILLTANRAENAITLQDSILDCGNTTQFVLSGNGGAFAGIITLENVTVFGQIKARRIPLASNTIFVATVDVEQRQEGCIRFSYVPPGSHVPRRYECVPVSMNDLTEALRVQPQFDAVEYGDPRYARLTLTTDDKIRRGADDGGEMGAFHSLFQPVREDYLRSRMEEYVRFGLEAGLIWAD